MDSKWRVLIVWIGLLLHLTVEAQITADFSVSNTQGCSPLTVNFTNLSTGPVTSHQWWFGNGNQSSQSDPSAIYYSPGVYDVKLVVSNGLVTDTFEMKNAITVFAPPSASITASPTSGCVPLPVNFTSSSTPGSAPISATIFDFGDGTVDTSSSSSHHYRTPGSYSVILIVTDTNGCNHTITEDSLIYIKPLPKVRFTAQNSTGCSPPLQVNFSNNTTGSGNVSFKWFFGDGDSSTAKNPTHSYTSDGSFNVSLIATDTAGCSDTLTKNALVTIEKEEAKFSYTPSNGCKPLIVNFTNTSSPGDPGSHYFWDFGDGDTSTAKNPTHTYTASGSYSVKLRVTNATGCMDSIVKSNIINVLSSPAVNFSANDTAGCRPPLTTTFTGSPTNGTSYLWDFGDGDTSHQKNPQHIFDSTGSYNIKLIVTGSNGCTDTLIKHDYIKVLPPVAKFNVSPGNGCVPLNVVFTDNSVTADAIISHEWDFGDGATSTQKNPTTIYSNVGDFPVKLTITTADGCVDSAFYSSVTVGDKPSADFTVDKRAGCIEDMKVEFTNLTNINATVLADTFYWDFGEGGTSWDTDPGYDYDIDSGFYTVTLVAWSNGCPDTAEKIDYIEIYPPYARFSIKRNICHADSIEFIDASVGATSYYWIFGDGDSSTQSNPSHQYPGPGTYEAQQIAYNSAYNCSDTAFRPITIDPPVSLDFEADKQTGCAPLHVSFTGISSQSAVSFVWDFGDGTIDSAESPTHIYENPGNYTVTMSIITEDSCVEKITKTHYISIKGPDAKFSTSPKIGCTPLLVSISDSSTSTAPIVSRFLNLGNGNSQNLTSPVFQYEYITAPKNQRDGFTISLIVVDSQGCSDTARQIIRPLKPEPSITPLPEPNCSTLDMVLNPASSDTNGLGPFQYLWRLGSGQTSTDTAPVLNFNVSGTRQITLIVTDSFGCIDSVTKQIEGTLKPLKANFGASPLSKSCPPLQATFFNTSTEGYAPITKYEWDFGDGTHSTRKNPRKIYLIPGRFSVKLEITDSIGCKDSLIKTDYISLAGPEGSYSFDTLEGCVPLTVEFSAETQNARTVTWDLGDGSIRIGDTIQHTYNDARTFIPLLILSDSFGCTYVLPPIDSVHVFEHPEAAFSVSGACFGYPTYFTDESIANADSITSWKWEFGNGDSSSQAAPAYIYDSLGYYDVTLISTNNHGCSDTVVQRIKIGGVGANFITEDNTYCVNADVKFINNSIADTIITQYKWSFGNGDSSSAENPVQRFGNSGPLDVKLVVIDALGCTDTSIKNNHILIGDTVPPPAPDVFRATVLNNFTIQLDFSKFKKNDFVKYVIYMANGNGNFIIYDSIFNINDTSIQISNLSPLDNSYCFKVNAVNACDLEAPPASLETHCTVELTARPGIRQSVLSWNHYTGWDSVAHYVVLRENLNAPGRFDSLAAVPGNVNLFIDSNIICYAEHFYKIKAVEKGGGRQISLSDTSGTEPVYIPDLPDPEVVSATVVQNKHVQVSWKIPAAEPLREVIIQRSAEGINYNDITAPLPPDIQIFTDTDVDVNANSYWYRVQYLDSCGDLSDFSNIGKTILLKVDTNFESKPRLRWTPYQEWAEGVKYYDIEIKEEDGSFTQLAKVDGDDSIFTDGISSINNRPSYCYRVVAHRDGTVDHPNQNINITSTSNEACAPIRSTIFAPNAFSPNDDDHNDHFHVKGTYILEYNIKIFDRWGMLVFESNSLEDQWDGKFKGSILPDAYVYIIDAQGADEKKWVINGMVTIVP